MNASRFASVGRALCLVGAALGVTGLVGWIAGIPALTWLIPGHPQSAPSTSLCLVLAGLAGALQARPDPGRTRTIVSRGAACIVVALGAVTLAGYALANDIDTLVALGGIRWTSPLSALALTLIGAALLLVNVRAAARPSEWMLLLAFLICLVALTGMLVSAPHLYRLSESSTIGMSVPAALGLLVMSFGLLLERPHGRLMKLAVSRGPGGTLLRRLALPLMAGPLLLAFVVGRSHDAGWIGDFSTALAILAITGTVTGLAVVAINAPPLDRADAAIRISEAKFSSIIAISADAIVAVDEDQRVTIFNEAASKTFGWEPHEVIGKPLDLLIPERFRESHRKHLRAFAAEPIKSRSMGPRGPLAALRKNGEEFYAEASVSKLEVEGEKVYSAVLRDVSERLRLEREIVEARKFLQNVLDSSTQYSIIVKDLNRRVMGWNEGARRLYGYEGDEIVGQSSDVLHTPDDLASGVVAELHRHALAEGLAEGIVHRRRKDGSEFLARATITRREDSEGNPIGYLLISRDVTAEQRQFADQTFLAELGNALQASLEQEATIQRVARLVVTYLGDVCEIDVVEDDGAFRRVKVVHADPAQASLVERIASAPLDLDRTHPVWTVRETRRSLLITRDAGAAAVAEPHRRLLESIGATSALLVPLVARDRLIAVLFVGSCRPDRTYKAEDLLLAEEVGRRSALALDNARLYETARSAIQTRDLVMGVVAHDLRNPLNAILLATAATQSGCSDPTARKAAMTIERAADRMNRLIQDLLDVTRIESGQLSIARAPLRTAPIVRHLVETQTPLAASASVELRLEEAGYLPEIYADRDRLLQIFENLVGNALKFTPRGGRITLGVAPRGSEVLFWVADTGRGIARDDLPHVFDRFWQASKVERHGAGLGLPIVKGLVEAHGGRIWVESTPGRGSVFFFTIPTVRPTHDAPREPAPHLA